MDLRVVIAKENSRNQALKVADYVGDSATRFKALVEVFLGGPYRITQRAAWPLSICVERHPQLAEPYYDQFLNFAVRPGVHAAVKRNVMRLLQFVTIPRKVQGKAMKVAFAFLQDRKEPIAVRVCAMTVIERIAEDKPDIRRELCVLIEDELPFAGPAFRSRGMKILRKAKSLMTQGSLRAGEAG